MPRQTASNHEEDNSPTDAKFLIPNKEELARREEEEKEKHRKNHDKLSLDLQVQQTAAQKLQATANRTIALLTGALVFTALVGLVVSYMQFQAAKDSANASLAASLAAVQQVRAAQDANLLAERNWISSERQSNAALNASITLSRSDQRAWIGVVEIATPAQINEGIELRPVVQVINTGKSPAIRVMQTAGYKILPKDQPINAAYEVSLLKPEFQGVIVPNGSRELAINDLGPIEKKQADELNSGEYRLYLFGRINYSDIFEKRHTTTFCARLSLGNHKAFAPFGPYNDAN